MPVYDAREVEFNLERDADKIEYLPRFEGEIPFGSFIVVGHSTSCYPKNDVWALSLNLLWVIIIGTPSA